MGRNMKRARRLSNQTEAVARKGETYLIERTDRCRSGRCKSCGANGNASLVLNFSVRGDLLNEYKVAITSHYIENLCRVDMDSVVLCRYCERV